MNLGQYLQNSSTTNSTQADTNNQAQQNNSLIQNQQNFSQNLALPETLQRRSSLQALHEGLEEQNKNNDNEMME